MLDAISQVLTADISWLWISARTFGICAWLASSVVVVVGLVTSTRLFGTKVSVRSLTRIHRAAATLTLLFVLLHIATLIPDPYAKLTLLDIVIPGQAPNQTLATALGTIAFLALVVVSLAGLGRGHMSNKVWKVLHSVAFVVWPLASIHFIVMGTDVMASWSLGMIAVVGGLLALLLLRRGYASPKPAPRRVPAATAMAAPRRPQLDRVAELLVTRVIDETADAKTFVFTASPDQAAGFNYEPGQHVTLRIPSDVTGSVARCYSLSSAPGVDFDLRVTVKRTPDGYASNWLCDNLRPGMRIQSLRPAGSFTTSPGMSELLLFAGGSGITPMMSIIKSAMHRQDARITLVYANRDEKSIIFREQLLDLALAHPGQLVVHHWLQSVAGIPTSSDVSEALAAHRDADVFVCGPKPYMDLVTTTALNFGWPQEQIHVEEFRSLEGDPFAPRSTTGAAAAGPSTVATRTAVAHVELDGDSHVVEWPEHSTLVDAMLDAGIDAPYSCLEGVCATCECKLVKGSVESAESAHAEGDRVLGCQVRPTTETVRVKF